ncbi:MAG: hypothetical protein HY533_04895 [Chloroflexi bacterium]|nr:hypothetical protein [Chloroflexota bacterium]
MDLPTMRSSVRRDLHDETGPNYRWTDDELDRHIQRAVNEVSAAALRERKAALNTAADSRDLSLASLMDLVAVEAVEYPTGLYPPRYVRYSLWAGALTLLVDTPPKGVESVNVYYGALHTLNATTSTLPAETEDLVAMGASAYAALEWANFAINRINVGGEEVWRQYLAWGQDRLAAYLEGIRKMARANAIRPRSLYVPAHPRSSQTTDAGP